jgi:hypothetical protein
MGLRLPIESTDSSEWELGRCARSTFGVNKPPDAIGSAHVGYTDINQYLTVTPHGARRHNAVFDMYMYIIGPGTSDYQL